MTLRRGQPWTDADDEVLRRLALAGTPVRIVAQQLCRSEEAIRQRKALLGLKRG